MRREVGELAADPDQLGDVMSRTHDPNRRTRMVGEDIAVAFEHTLGNPVGQVHAVGEFKRADLGDRPLQNAFDPRDVVGVHQRPVGVVIEIGVRGVAEHRKKLVGPLHLVGDQVPLPDARPGDRLHMTEPPLAQLRDILFIVTSGIVDNLIKNIAPGTDRPVPARVTGSQRTATDLQPPGGAVGRLPPGLARFPVRDHARQRQSGLGDGQSGGNHVVETGGGPHEYAKARRIRCRTLLMHHRTARHKGEQGPVSPNHTAVGCHHQ